MKAKLLNEMRKIVNKYDPVGIYYTTEAFNEYDPEIRDIYTSFKKSKVLNEFTKEVHNVFVKWFFPSVAGKREKYIDLSKDLFKLLKNQNKIY